jgi:hypothetical protein
MTDGMTPASVPIAMRVLWPVFRVVQRVMTPERAARSSVTAATDAQDRGRHLAGPQRPSRHAPEAAAVP